MTFNKKLAFLTAAVAVLALFFALSYKNFSHSKNVSKVVTLRAARFEGRGPCYSIDDFNTKSLGMSLNELTKHASPDCSISYFMEER